MLIDPDSGMLLAQQSDAGFALPVLEIPRWSRPAAQIQRAIRKRWGWSAVILNFFPDCDERTSWAAAEVLTSEKVTGAEKLSPSLFVVGDLDEKEAAQLAVMLRGGAGRAPFERLGWIGEAIEWVETASGHPLSSRSEIEQLNAGGHFALLRFTTQGGKRYWLKAAGDPNLQELSITATLSKLGGRHLPELIAIRPAWNAWISSEDAFPIGDLPRDASHLKPLLERLVLSMAELQIATVGRSPELSASGAFDQSIARLRTDSDAMFQFLAEAMDNQTSTKVPPLTPIRLQELQAILNEACDRLEALGIPDTIVHGDLNPGNILVARECCQFIDWAEGYIGFPFASLEHLLLLNKLEIQSERDVVNRYLRSRYGEAWSEVCEASRIQEALRLAPVLAIVSVLYGRGDWISSPSRLAPERQSYARTLARRMDGAARAPEFLEALCTK